MNPGGGCTAAVAAAEAEEEAAASDPLGSFQSRPLYCQRTSTASTAWSFSGLSGSMSRAPEGSVATSSTLRPGPSLSFSFSLSPFSFLGFLRAPSSSSSRLRLWPASFSAGTNGNAIECNRMPCNAMSCGLQEGVREGQRL